ncbi:MAG TPA: hypothetical protein DIW20_04215 [Rhodospirillaceae bacterium]|nr:hypothetical protein [Rhodospirillaceae bacterium]
MKNDTPVTLTQGELQSMLDKAAESGARKALHDIGLADDQAGTDVRDLRSLLSAWRVGKRTAFKVAVQNITNLLFVMILLGVAVKLGIKFGG